MCFTAVPDREHLKSMRRVHLSGLYMARHEAWSREAWHTNCAPCQVCQPASQTNSSLAFDQESGWTVGNVLFFELNYIHNLTLCRHYSLKFK